MPKIFANGGAEAGYPGVSAADVTAVLTLIRDTCVSAGWTMTGGSPSSLPMRLSSGLEYMGQRAHLSFDSPATGKIRILIDRDGDGLLLETGQTTDFQTNVSATNTVWVTADESNAVFAVLSSASVCNAVWFGHVNRQNPADLYAWGHQSLTSSNSTNSTTSGRLARTPAGASFETVDRGTGGFAFHLNPFTGASPINVADLNRIVPSLYSRFCGASYYRGDCPLVSSGFLGSTIGDIYTFEQDGILSVYLSNGEAGILIDELEVTP